MKQNRGKPLHHVAGATVNARILVGARCRLLAVWVTNTGAAIAFLKLFDTVLQPVPGQDAPALSFGVPGNAAGAGGSWEIPEGGALFRNGCGMAMVTGAADTDATAVVANQMVANFVIVQDSDQD